MINDGGHSFLNLLSLDCTVPYEVDCMPENVSTLRGYIEVILGKTTSAVVFPIVTLFSIVLFFIYYKKVSRPLGGSTEWIGRRMSKTRMTIIAARHPMEKKDIIPLVAITAAFTFLAMFRLGDTVAPQSFFQFSHENNSIIIELQTPEEISSVMYYTGLWSGHYELEFSEDGVTWHKQRDIENKTPGESSTPAMNQAHSHLFKWRYAELNDDNPVVKYIRLTASRTPMELGELALYDITGAVIPSSRIISPDAPKLFDEQELIPSRPTYMNGMYFDEIYHGRTGYEFLCGITPYETTHPPLGKEIISASIFALGMTPFGWRFIGALTGVIMLIVLYIFIKNMFGKTPVAICGTLLLGFDFMRFVQTRIATIDTYGVFFILLAYFFMYRYITTDAEAPFKKSLVPLALSGAAFGAGCASKWITAYAGLGLAAIYIVRFIHLYKYYRGNGLQGFRAHLTKTLLFSVLFFGVVPVAIYCLSYIPYGLAQDMTIEGGMLWDSRFYSLIWNNQVFMLDYHGMLISQHIYSSVWWQWILDARPILYVSSFNYGNNFKSTFGAFGNPVVWWGGFVAVVVMAVQSIKSRDGKALFILIGYLSQLLPWIAISRVVFIYHYFPSTLFLVLALSHVFNTILERAHGHYKQAVYGYTAATGTTFAMFYPALTGIYVPNWYFTSFLRWIPVAWPF